MSECVVRMEMPNGCHWRNQNAWSGMKVCPAVDYEQGNCLLDPLERNTADYVEKRPLWCPIICSLPEGHGRLGDLDELAAGCDDPYWCRWLSEIEDAPTIVPADTAEEGET